MIFRFYDIKETGHSEDEINFGPYTVRLIDEEYLTGIEILKNGKLLDMDFCGEALYVLGDALKTIEQPYKRQILEWINGIFVSVQKAIDLEHSTFIEVLMNQMEENNG